MGVVKDRGADRIARYVAYMADKTTAAFTGRAPRAASDVVLRLEEIQRVMRTSLPEPRREPRGARPRTQARRQSRQSKGGQQKQCL